MKYDWRVSIDNLGHTSLKASNDVREAVVLLVIEGRPLIKILDEVEKSDRWLDTGILES